MFSESHGILLTIFLVIAICVIALIGVGYSFVQTWNQLSLNNQSALAPDRKFSVYETQTNYNFAIPVESAEEEEKEEEKPEPKVEEKEEKKDKPIYNYNFQIPKKKPLPQMAAIEIPKIDYKSPIIISDDGDSAVDKGAWHHPSNHPLEGEAIFLCHRRYFLSNDQKSCWNLDQLKKGNSMYIYFDDGTQAYYKIQSISVTKGTDVNVYHTSSENLIKLISCSMEDGKIGSTDYRIVVIAEMVSYS